ncbi:MAG: FAD-dependent oxidoreductase [Myxococcota bacterium]
MAKVLVVGDGPGGLSAALFLAKNGVSVTVYGQDKTAMHWAMLYNYLGIPEMTGAEFQKVARKQVEGFGATLVDARVEAIDKVDGGFRVKLEDGAEATAEYLILSEGKSPRLATMLGLKVEDGAGVQVDHNSRSSLEGCYVVGRLARPGRSQAIISAGDGGAAAIDILSQEKGENFADWDSPPKDE